jgi:NAD(P)-dependent dehydrogenase (short-subunit alcohol dehydrogenase family)
VKEYGRIDIMVNNAGIAMEAGEHGSRPIWDYEGNAFDKTVDVNVKGVFWGTKYASKQMVGQEPGAGGDRGWIINLSSVYGMRGSIGICKLRCFSLLPCLFLSFMWWGSGGSWDEALHHRQEKEGH